MNRERLPRYAQLGFLKAVTLPAQRRGTFLQMRPQYFGRVFGRVPSTLEHLNVYNIFSKNILTQSSRRSQRTMCYYQIFRSPYTFSYFHNDNKQKRGIWLSHYIWLSAFFAPLRGKFLVKF
jgi:hypothetical protein